VALLGCLRRDRFGLDMVWYLVLVAPVLAFWWLPFLAYGREKVGLGRAGLWRHDDVAKLERRLQALLAPAAALVLAAIFLGGAGLATLGLGGVVAAGVWMRAKGRYPVHAATFDLAVLVTGMFAVAWSSGLVTPLVYLVLLWFLHRVETPVQDGAGYVRPLRCGPQEQAIRYLVSELPDTSRVALEFVPGSGSGWDHGRSLDRLLAHAVAEQDKIELLSGAAPDQTASELTEYQQQMNLKAGSAQLVERMQRVGTRYLISHTPELGSQLAEVGFRELRSVELSGFERHGRFREGQTTTLRLFEAPGEITRITPVAVIERRHNRMSFPAKAGQRYLLKFVYFRGWRVSDAEGKELLVSDARPGMWITVPAHTTVHLRYSWWNYLRR
jgi:hypothetical protein